MHRAVLPLAKCHSYYHLPDSSDDDDDDDDDDCSSMKRYSRGLVMKRIRLMGIMKGVSTVFTGAPRLEMFYTVSTILTGSRF